jgi:hypothetical protein
MSRRSVLTSGAAVVAGTALGAAGTTAGAAQASPDGAGDGLPDPLAATTAMAVRFDRKQWSALREVFTTRVYVDYTRLGGGKPATVNSAELVGDWQRNLGHLDATQHLLTNQVVEERGREATATADFQATHRIGPMVGGRLWVLGGSYEYGLVRVGRGWRISAVTMIPSWESGDRTVIGLPARP